MYWIELNCCVISFTALIDLISWNQTIDYLYSDGCVEVDPAGAGPGRTAPLASPRARESCHRGCRHRPRVRGTRRPRNVMLIMAKFFQLPDTLLAHALVLPRLRLQALVPMVQRQPHRVFYFLDCPRKFRLRPLWWLQKKLRRPYFTRAEHRIVQNTHFNCNRHNWQLCINQ